MMRRISPELRLLITWWLLLWNCVEAQNQECQTDGGDETCTSTKQWQRSPHTIDDFTVAGINLASYPNGPSSDTKIANSNSPFELFEDFDIGDLVTGNENWEQMLAIRNTLQRPSLSFYVDKVARKRWLPTKGYNNPKLFSLQYKSELEVQGTIEEQARAIHKRLPTEADYCAKPTHMSMTQGTWLVRYDKETRNHLFSSNAMGVQSSDHVNTQTVADSLVKSLHSPPNETESWALKNVQPGYVVEERWTSHTNDNIPPHEMNIFTIWGRVWVGQYNTAEEDARYCDGFVYRNGTFSHGSYLYGKEMPEWANWGALVELAEELGANKDMFRLDVFVGVPASVKPMSEGATEEERMQHLEIAISESEIFPTTIFPQELLPEEAARLWIAGYKIGNYKVIPNTEVPEEYIRTGQLSTEESKWYSKET